MDIKIIGEGCDKCDNLYKNTCDALQRLSLEAKVEKVSDLIEIVKLGVMSTPSLMINGKVVLLGQVASTEKIMKLLKK